MTRAHLDSEPVLADRNHLALHLAHRWFAFFEASGGDLDAHLQIFHPQVRLSGHRGSHLLASDRERLAAWLVAVPDEISSYRIVHSNYLTADNGDGLLNMVVAYQAPSYPEIHGSIISYETRVEFAQIPRFSAIDKTPILPNKRHAFEPSWSTNRVLARVHAELGGITGSDGQLRIELGSKIREILAHSTALTGSKNYQALVTATGGDPDELRVVRLQLADDVKATMPTIEIVEPLPLLERLISK
ncbi:hypothetical protein [Pseudomonas kitaguniensis]|uniref:hypothetical protein n=1 Tax=Pseudomonas kitaguniensis TaxID=2607908 RepID=UPI003D041944